MSFIFRFFDCWTFTYSATTFNKESILSGFVYTWTMRLHQSIRVDNNVSPKNLNDNMKLGKMWNLKTTALSWCSAWTFEDGHWWTSLMPHSLGYIQYRIFYKLLFFFVYSGIPFTTVIQIIGTYEHSSTETGLTENCMKTQEIFDVNMLWCNVGDYSRASLK